jgi:hypothetical protein
MINDLEAVVKVLKLRYEDQGFIYMLTVSEVC